MEMDPQRKVMLSINVFPNCTLNCCVTCTADLILEYQNQKILVVDPSGVAHEALVNLCPENAKTIDIAEFMTIVMTMNKITNGKNNNNNIPNDFVA